MLTSSSSLPIVAILEPLPLKLQPPLGPLSDAPHDAEYDHGGDDGGGDGPEGDVERLVHGLLAVPPVPRLRVHLEHWRLRRRGQVPSVYVLVGDAFLALLPCGQRAGGVTLQASTAVVVVPCAGAGAGEAEEAVSAVEAGLTDAVAPVLVAVVAGRAIGIGAALEGERHYEKMKHTMESTLTTAISSNSNVNGISRSSDSNSSSNSSS